jgi:surface-anchored protein
MLRSMTNTNVKNSFFTSVAIALAMSASSMAQTLYTGHYDIEAHYHEGALEVALHNHDAVVSYELSGSNLPMFQIGFGNATGTAPAPQQNLTIGGTSLGSVWVNAHSEASANLLNQPFIGFSAEELGDGWTGNVTFTLKSLQFTGTGLGKLFLFEDETVFWNSTLTSASNLGSFSIGVGQHGHGEFAFSDEGLYALQLEVSGTLNDTPVTSAPGTLKINVVPEPSTGVLLMAGLATLSAVRRRTRR